MSHGLSSESLGVFGKLPGLKCACALTFPKWSFLEFCRSVYEKLFEASVILSDVNMLSGGHSYKLWWTFSMSLGIFSVFLSDIMSDVL